MKKLILLFLILWVVFIYIIKTIWFGCTVYVDLSDYYNFIKQERLTELYYFNFFKNRFNINRKLEKFVWFNNGKNCKQIIHKQIFKVNKNT